MYFQNAFLVVSGVVSVGPHADSETSRRSPSRLCIGRDDQVFHLAGDTFTESRARSAVGREWSALRA